MRTRKKEHRFLAYFLVLLLITGGILSAPEIAFATVDPPFQAVTDITGVPTTATAGSGVTLNGTVIPGDATNQAIEWSIDNAGTTGASISGNTLTTVNPGQVSVVATVVSGAALGINFTKNFTVMVNAPMNVSSVKVISFNADQTPSLTTIEIEMNDIGLDVGAFTVSNDTTPGSTVTVNNVTYINGKYTVSFIGMTFFDSYTLTITKEGYSTYTNSSFFGALATAADLDLTNEPNIFETYSRTLTEPGIVTIGNTTYSANARLYSGSLYTDIDTNNDNPDNGTIIRLIGIFAKAPNNAKAVKTLRTNGQVLQVANDSLIDANPNYQETVQSGLDYYNAHINDIGFVDNNRYFDTVAFLPMYSQVATERQSDNSRILVDPNDRFRIIEWYDNTECTGNPIKVTRLMVKVNYTGSITSVGGAGLTNVLNKAITLGPQAGTSEEPKTASINVISSISTLGLSGIVADADASVSLYTDDEFSQEITGVSTIALTAGGVTTAYIKVTGYSGSPVCFYKVDIHRAEIESAVTAYDSEELALYMSDTNVSMINLLSEVAYQYDGGTISREVTINGNGATIIAGIGVADDIIRADGVTFYGLGNFTNERTFLKVAGASGYLKLNNLILENGINKVDGVSTSDGFCSVINIKPAASLEMDGVTMKGFHNNPTPGLKTAYGVHAEPGAANTIIKNSNFDSSNALRNAVSIRDGNFNISNCTFQGTEYPDRLRQDDGYEYAIYIYGGIGEIKNNTITDYVNKIYPGYSSAGIAAIGFYSLEITIEDNLLLYNDSGIDITGYWSTAGTNRNIEVNGLELTTSEDAFTIGENLKRSNEQENVSVSFNQSDEVEVGPSGSTYFTVLGGYRSPYITVTNMQDNTLTVQLPAAAIDILNAVTSIGFEAQIDGSSTWTTFDAVHFPSTTVAELTLTPGHTYKFRLKMTHNSFVEENDPILRILTTYSNPISNPEAPSNVSAAAGDRSAVVSFVAPVGNGGSSITGYKVYVYQNGVLQSGLTATGSSSPITVTGLSSQTAYTFKVAAVNALGESLESAASNEVTTFSRVATLSGLIVNGGNLNPAFATGTTSYTLSVAYNVSSITLRPTATNGNATIRVNGTAVVSGQTSGAIALSVGSNTITISITAQDGVTVNTYTITVIRADYVPNNSGQTVTSPTPGVEKITVEVKQGNTDSTVSKITIERTTKEDGTKIDNVTYEKEKAQETVQKLKEEGKDTARIVIPDTKNEVSETKVNIPSSSIGILSEGGINLQIDTEVARINIDKNTLGTINKTSEEDLYFRLVPVRAEKEKAEVSERALFAVGVINANSDDRLELIGNPVTIETNMSSIEADITLPLTGVEIPSDPAEREALLQRLAVYIEHTDGEKELVQGEIVEYANGTYGIKFHINKFSIFTVVKTDAFLKSSESNIIKVISPADAIIKGTKITASVADTVDSLTVKVKVSSKATWRLYSDKAGNKLISGNKLTLKTGANNAYIKVTSESGGAKIYQITITRSKSSKAVITKVSIPEKAIVKGKTVTATVDNVRTSLILKASVSSKASWRLYSDKACTKALNDNKLELKVGTNIAYVKVIAENGTTSNVYTLKVTRKATEIKYDAHVKLGLIGSKTYALRVAKIFEQYYDSANVSVKPEGKYYRVSMDFIDQKAAKKACEDMIDREYIINYVID